MKTNPKSKSKDQNSRYFDDKKPIKEEEKVFQVNEKKTKFIPKFKQGKKFRKNDNLKAKFPGAAPIDPSLIEKHSRGPSSSNRGVKTNVFKEKLKKKEVYYEFANEQAARTELLLKEDEGFIEPDEEEQTVEYTQEDIKQNIDITAAAKGFELNLDFGPYRMSFTKDGKSLLLGGKKGHVASFDWLTKTLNCEMNVMEEVRDVAWLHQETMFAVAQKSWVYIYDKRGTELHCLKNLFNVNRLEFLPYHFLLASGSETGYLSWLDVTIGQIVAGYHSKVNSLRIMCQNPSNATICLGDSKGVVSMWAPSQRESLAKILCHSTPLSAVTVDPTGKYMATAGMDRQVKIWDLRELNEPLQIFKTRSTVGDLKFSQRGALALAIGNIVEIYKKPTENLSNPTPYLRQKFRGSVSDFEFCPFEDLLGVSYQNGYASLIVPGSGEPNFDARESNPFHSLTQRREHEVHSILNKIPMEFISLDPDQIGSVDVPTLKDKIDAKKQLLFLKVPQIDFQPRHKMKGKGGSANASRNKQIVKDQAKREHHKEMRAIRQEIIKEHQVSGEESQDFIPLESKKGKQDGVLGRFRDKNKARKQL